MGDGIDLRTSWPMALNEKRALEQLRGRAQT
jgi:hypothetical protein